MKQMLMQTLMQVVMMFASKEVMTAAVDGFLDVVEDAVAKSDNKIDDIIVLPVVKQVREVFNVPDND